MLSDTIGPLVLTFACPFCLPAEGVRDVPDISTVRHMLRVDEFKQERADLIALGAKTFPAYEQILKDPKAGRDEISRIFGVLSAVNADRNQFLEHAIAGLTSSDTVVRLSAVALLGQIGSERDVAPVVALLSDETWEVSFAAAKTLAAIGDRRALAAMNVWLNSGLHRANAAGYEAQRKHVIKCRDELKERLDTAKKPDK
jgi:HEAT repeat protein